MAERNALRRDAANVLDFGVATTPGISDLRDIAEFTSGIAVEIDDFGNPVQREMTTGELWITGGAIFAPVVGAAWLRKVWNWGEAAGDVGRKVPDGTTLRGPSLGQKQGRDFRTDQLELYEFDPNQPNHVRGFLENERRRIAGSGGGPDIPRTPPGYVQAHGRSTPAREGYDYSNSRLQGEDLNKLEERVRRRQGRQ